MERRGYIPSMTFSDVNVEIFRMINDLGKHYPYLNSSAVFIAEYTVYFLALAMIFYWFSRKNSNRMMIICGVVTVIFAEIAGKIAGQFHFNNQPFAELPNVNQLIEKTVDNSFPSDHTIIFFSLCMIFWLFKKKIGLLWITLAVLVGISRIWVGVHYPADVAVGAIISIVAAVIVYKIVPNLEITKKALALYEKGESFILPTKDKARDL